VTDPIIEQPRFLPLVGPVNFRDLGGYRSASGRHTRWRTLFRADGLQYVTPDDVITLRPYALQTVIDLRSQGEIELRGQFPVDAYPVTLHHLAVTDETWNHSDPSLHDMDTVTYIRTSYASMLERAAPQFAEAFAHLAAPDALPAVFHCAAGKDRTGLLAALLLGSLGVANEDIITDYALSALVVKQMFDRVSARSPEAAEQVRNAPKAIFTADPLAMEATLADLDHKHGSISNYLQHIGVPLEALTRLRTSLLENE
jgi:protein-tyrosine phosphatase